VAKFDDYANKYKTIRMERRNGILQMAFHTDGGPLRWGLQPHRDFTYAFADVGSDTENKVIILTGTGDEFSGPRPSGPNRTGGTPRAWDAIYWEGKHHLQNLLDIEDPMISAINGPALRHCEIPLLAISYWRQNMPNFRIRRISPPA
jgi:enoyl-CoA hydratase/carnithine racemase